MNKTITARPAGVRAYAAGIVRLKFYLQAEDLRSLGADTKEGGLVTAVLQAFEWGAKTPQRSRRCLEPSASKLTVSSTCTWTRMPTTRRPAIGTSWKDSVLLASPQAGVSTPTSRR